MKALVSSLGLRACQRRLFHGGVVCLQPRAVQRPPVTVAQTKDSNQPPHGSLGDAPDTSDDSRRGGEGCHALPTVSLPPTLALSVDKLIETQPRSLLREDTEALSMHLMTRSSKETDTPIIEREKRKSDRITQVETLMQLHGLSKSKAQRLVAMGELQAHMNETKENKKDKKGGQKKSQQRAVPHTMQYRWREGVAYAAGTMPMAYAATYRVLKEIADRVPGWAPQSMLDFGSGTASAVWAANEVWEGRRTYECVDISQHMMDLAGTLLGEGPEKHISDIHFRRFMPVAATAQAHPLAVAAFALCELPDMVARRNAVVSMWGRTTDFLVLIEPGNSDGYRNIMEARDMLLEASQARILAPCPHQRDCPMKEKQKPCAFGQRAAYTQLQTEILNSSKLKQKTFRVQEFSYLVVAKGRMAATIKKDETAKWERLVTPPLKRGSHVICDTCTPDGTLERTIYSRADSDLMYKDLRKRYWGDRLRPLETYPDYEPVDDSEDED